LATSSWYCFDVAELAAAGSEIDDCFAWIDVGRGVSAAVIAVDDLLRNYFQILLVVDDRTAQCRLTLLGRGGMVLD